MEDSKNTDAPSYCYDQTTKQWELSFLGVDSGGYDAVESQLYFDSEEDLIEFLKR